MSSFAGLFIMIGLFALGNDLKTAARTLAEGRTLAAGGTAHE